MSIVQGFLFIGTMEQIPGRNDTRNYNSTIFRGCNNATVCIDLLHKCANCICHLFDRAISIFSVHCLQMVNEAFENFEVYCIFTTSTCCTWNVVP